MKKEITRRRFIEVSGLVAASLMLGPGCRSEAGDAVFKGVRTITDDAGREVEIPTPSALERIYYTSALAQVFVFSLAPKLMAGTAFTFTKQELELLPPEMATLPNLGSLSGNGEIDREELVAKGVQLVFSISGVALTQSNISDAEKLQKQTGIPVVCIDGSFDKIANAYRFLGDILGVEQRAEELAGYLEDVYEEVVGAVGDIPDDEKVSLYYAEGPLGLQTEPDVSQHALTFEIAGARNVAAVPEAQGLGMSNVSLESVIAWNPDVIVAWDDVVRGGADEIIRTKESWSTIQAVKDGRVYTMPNIPYAWCDRPPGVNRFIGIQWVANMLYPDRFDVDMVERTQEFYSKMYWVDITTDQALAILGNSYPAYGKEAKYTPSADFEDFTSDTGLSSDDMSQRIEGGY